MFDIFDSRCASRQVPGNSSTAPFDQIANLVKDEERLHLSLEKLKVDADQVQRDMRRFFTQIKGEESE